MQLTVRLEEIGLLNETEAERERKKKCCSTMCILDSYVVKVAFSGHPWDTH